MLYHWGYVSGVLISSTAKSAFQIGLLLSLLKKEKKKKMVFYCQDRSYCLFS